MIIYSTIKTFTKVSALVLVQCRSRVEINCYQRVLCSRAKKLNNVVVAALFQHRTSNMIYMVTTSDSRVGRMVQLLLIFFLFLLAGPLTYISKYGKYLRKKNKPLNLKTAWTQRRSIYRVKKNQLYDFS